jgi:hypothetical protein
VLSECQHNRQNSDGCANPAIDIGANASAEEAEEALDDTVSKVNNIVHSFRLQSTSFDKKGFLTYLKGTSLHPAEKPRVALSFFSRSCWRTSPLLQSGYMKSVKAKLQAKGDDAIVKEFETGAQKFVKETILPNFKDFEFYTGESMNPDGM